MNGQRKWVVSIHNGRLFTFKRKEGNPVILANMDEPRRLYAKWNKPDTERYILHDLMNVWNLN